ncbi:MAG TPA: DEAD/DEAH box helicase, partial [Gemmatimonadaceae bacterium]
MPGETGKLIEVALPVPLFQTFTYALDPESERVPVAGSRVVVPLRTGKEIGICLGPADGQPPRKVRRVKDVPDEEPVLNERMIGLCRWMADYYFVPLGVVMRSVLPALLTGVTQPQPTRKTRRVVRIRQDLPTLTQRDKAFARATQQRTLFELLESLGGVSTIDHLLEQLAFSPSVLKGLEKRGLIEVVTEEVDRDPFATRIQRVAPPHVPTFRQRAAIERLTSANPGEVFLLHGVTGSGKTLVYIELLRKVVQQDGRTAIVLVPEIALTPQTVDRFRAVFGDSIAVLHS